MKNVHFNPIIEIIYIKYNKKPKNKFKAFLYFITCKKLK